jgi:hypothetical protein
MSQARLPAELRHQVRHRAGGRCEYCHLPEAFAFAPHQVDHIMAEKHRGPSSADNLALSCIACNQFKGTDLSSIDPLLGRPTLLFHPRKQQWSDHFRFDGARIRPLTATGRVTVLLLRLNDPERLAERRLLLQAGALRPP